MRNLKITFGLKLLVCIVFSSILLTGCKSFRIGSYLRGYQSGQMSARQDSAKVPRDKTTYHEGFCDGYLAEMNVLHLEHRHTGNTEIFPF